jgi:ankyrin repeat protein
LWILKAIHNQRNNDFGVLNSLIISGAKVSTQNKYGETPIIRGILNKTSITQIEFF